MKPLTRLSKPYQLPNFIHQHLHRYALAASAAGVSMLALAQPGQAEIIYTPANIEGPGILDLNGDGTVDFTFRFRAVQSSNFISVTAVYAGNGVMGNNSWASALLPGAQIGPSASFKNEDRIAAGFVYRGSHRHFWACYGPWKNVHKRYLGLKFMIGGEVHYGWARLNEACRRGVNSARLTGYAYETIPDQGIVAGQEKGALENESWTEPNQPTPASVRVSTQATLVMLAEGAHALWIWRRE